ncbi:hypothetical protein ACFE04_013014 [Oxalis oulophora]
MVYSYIADIVPGRIDWLIKVCVTRKWNVPNFFNPQEIKSLDIVLQDEKGDRIHCSIKKELIPQFQDKIHEGLAVYSIHNLLVASSKSKQKVTRNEYKLCSMKSTVVTLITGEVITHSIFDFVNFSTILETDDLPHMIDIIGHVVEKTNIIEKEKNGKTFKYASIVIEDLEHTRLKCTLWGEFAKTVIEKITNEDSSKPLTIILQMCIVTKYNSQNEIATAYHGTKFYINKNMPEEIDYLKQLLDKEDTLTQTISTMSGYSSINELDDFLQTEKKTLSEFVEVKEDCCVVVHAKIDGVDVLKKWSYESCAKCFSKVITNGSKFICEKCEDFVTTIPRFRLEVRVIDDTGSALFIMFDSAANKIIGKNAADVIMSSKEGEFNNSGPIEFDILKGKEFLFKVELLSTSKPKQYEGYTIKRITSDPIVIKKFKEHHKIMEEDDASDLVFVGESSLLKEKNSEGFDANSDILNNDAITPKNLRVYKKRARQISDSISLSDDGTTQNSSSKLPKNVKVKIEPNT